MNKQSYFQTYFFVILLIAGSSLLLAGCGSELGVGGKATKLVHLRMAPLSEMPDYVQEAEPETQEAYRFAVANPEALEHIPCYCGCNSLGHMNNAECYAKTFNPDGTVAEFDNHAAYWGICVDITRDVMDMMEQGEELAEIRDYIDTTYSEVGPPTDTKPVQTNTKKSSN